MLMVESSSLSYCFPPLCQGRTHMLIEKIKTARTASAKDPSVNYRGAKDAAAS